MNMRRSLLAVAATLAAGLSGCGGGVGEQQTAPPPAAPPAYAAMRDTLVCVIDRAAPSGLVQLSAKVDGQQVVVLDGNTIVPLENVHPVSVIAGYAGREGWLSRGDPLTLQSNRFIRSSGERRIEPVLLRRVGEFMGILLFAGATDDPPPDALYVPTAPGCIFQPYVREDLIRR